LQSALGQEKADLATAKHVQPYKTEGKAVDQLMLVM